MLPSELNLGEAEYVLKGICHRKGNAMGSSVLSPLLTWRTSHARQPARKDDGWVRQLYDEMERAVLGKVVE